MEQQPTSSSWNEASLCEAARIYRQIAGEYTPDDDAFCPDPPKVRELKRIVAGLPEADKIMFLLYSEVGSITKLGKLLDVKRSTIYKEIRRIRTHIRNEYNSTHSDT